MSGNHKNWQVLLNMYAYIFTYIFKYILYIYIFKKLINKGAGGLVVKSTYCSCQGLVLSTSPEMAASSHL